MSFLCRHIYAACISLPPSNLEQSGLVLSLECVLRAGELYPTQVRTTAHGFSAGFAKLGGLWSTIFFNYLSEESSSRFWCLDPPLPA